MPPPRLFVSTAKGAPVASSALRSGELEGACDQERGAAVDPIGGQDRREPAQPEPSVIAPSVPQGKTIR